MLFLKIKNNKADEYFQHITCTSIYKFYFALAKSTAMCSSLNYIQYKLSLSKHNRPIFRLFPLKHSNFQCIHYQYLWNIHLSLPNSKHFTTWIHTYISSWQFYLVRILHWEILSEFYNNIFQHTIHSPYHFTVKWRNKPA